MRQISLCIPTYNRKDLLQKSFEKVFDNEAITEIVISDDCSDLGVYADMQALFEGMPKIKLFRNEKNKDCYQNKKIAVELATNKWVILLDSDNVIDFDYLFRIFQLMEWKEDTAYLPSFAAPHFDYRKYEGLEITKENVQHYMHDPTFTTCLNTHNHFVNRKFYLKCWDGSVDPHTADSIYMNYLYLKNGGKLYVVPGLTYQHRVDNHYNEQPGHYQTNCHKTGNFHSEVEQMLKALR